MWLQRGCLAALPRQPLSAEVSYNIFLFEQIYLLFTTTWWDCYRPRRIKQWRLVLVPFLTLCLFHGRLSVWWRASVNPCISPCFYTRTPGGSSASTRNGSGCTTSLLCGAFSCFHVTATGLSGRTSESTSQCWGELDDPSLWNDSFVFCCYVMRLLSPQA